MNINSNFKQAITKILSILIPLSIVLDLVIMIYLKSYNNFNFLHIISIFLVAITFTILNKIDNKKISIKKKNTILTLLVVSLFIVFIFKNLKI